MDPLNGGLSLFPVPGNVGVRSGQQEAYIYQSYLPRLDELLNSKLALCHYVTAAVQAGLTPQRGHSDRSTFWVHWNLPAPIKGMTFTRPNLKPKRTPPFGGACVCNLWNHKVPFGVIALSFDS